MSLRSGSSRTGTSKYFRWRKQVLARGLADGIRYCPRCGVWLDYEVTRRPNSAEPDHVVPYSMGGTDTVENGQVLCRRCNQSLGDKNRPRSGHRGSRFESIDFLEGGSG
ncbi:HNH endonuclease [Auritidibacter ignavus]|uniref:HNH endonuclease n=1 Tax=Auritidibacter ignavus TaxID=678932 RepID=UPI003A5CADC4